MSKKLFKSRPIPYRIKLIRMDEDKEWEGMLTTEYHFTFRNHDYHFSFDNAYLDGGPAFFLLMKRDYRKEDYWYSTTIHYDLPKTIEMLELIMTYE